MLNKKIGAFILAIISVAFCANAIDNPGITQPVVAPERFTLISDGHPLPLLIDEADNIGVRIAAGNLSNDFRKVCGQQAEISHNPGSKKMIVAGTLDSRFIRELVKNKKIDKSELQGKTEKYVMATVSNPFEGVDEALVIAGSDRRGTIYGIYELSEQIGVSPWYDWADVPIAKQKNLSIAKGKYTAGEPAVRYRGIFLNDEAPCLTSWVKNTYGDRKSVV